MMIYRWQDGAILPDAGLATQLGVTDAEDFDGWLQVFYPDLVLSIGQDFVSIQVQSYRTPRDESCLIAVRFTSHYLVIWCEHGGDLLACLNWLTPFVERAYRLGHATAMDQRVVDRTARTDADLEADARIRAAGHTQAELERLDAKERDRRRQARAQAMASRQEARARRRSNGSSRRNSRKIYR
jgi:hypothetical protein